MHRITQHANSRDGDLDHVARSERAHASGRAGGDYVAGEERHHAGNPPDKKSAGINHEGCVAGLANGAVDARFNENVGGIKIGFYVRTNRAESVEALSTGKLNIALLYVARGDIVEARVAKNVG